MAITIFEKGDLAGVGMPYRDDENIRLMLANIASIEIPPISEPYIDWVLRQPLAKLKRYDVDAAEINDRTFFPRLMLGEYFRDQFQWLVEQVEANGYVTDTREACEVTDVDPTWNISKAARWQNRVRP